MCESGMKPPMQLPIGNHHFFTINIKYHVIGRPIKIIKDLCKAESQYIGSIYVLASQSFLIILVGLAMTCYSEKMMISYSCIRGFMPNLHKKC